MLRISFCGSNQNTIFDSRSVFLEIEGMYNIFTAIIDGITCCRLFKLQNDYLVHGEIQITRLGGDGKINWQFGGADIFVSIEGEEFNLADDHIAYRLWKN